MEDKWRIVFCSLVVPAIFMPMLFGGWFVSLLLYLWTGILIWGGCEFRYPKIILAWLPALWIERVRNWSSK